ncbi:MAG: hypothetical protein M1839_000837 [Geoglossum umbratile]|nr:MAG: hypothetical protein M1839_000837 [Geoglossum umbratile]
MSTVLLDICGRQGTQEAHQHGSQQSSYGFNSQRQYRNLESLPRYHPAITMESGELTSTPQNPMGLGVWPLTPPENDVAPGEGTIEARFPYSLSSEQYPATSTWGTSNFSNPEYETIIAQGFPAAGHYLGSSAGQYDQKLCGDNVDVHGLDSEIGLLGQGFAGCDEDMSILDLRYPIHGLDSESLPMDTNFSRRLSGSSFSGSSVADGAPYEDLSASSYVSDFTSRSSVRLSTPLSPVASPRLQQQSSRRQEEPFRNGRSPPSPPRSNFRAAPYSTSGHSRRSSEYGYQSQEHFKQTQGMSSRHSSPTMVDSSGMRHQVGMNNFQPQALMSQQHAYYHGLPQSSFQDRCQQFETPPPLLSHSLFRMLHSNADLHSHHHSHYSDMSDPPDLYASLHEEQIPPPPEDMNPSDPDMIPHEQELRFDGDLYTPRWVRGHGNKREGWCGICKPGRWLVLKNSAFWYDKSFTHGISAATGSPFQEPQEVRRMDGNPDVWEGLCGSCNEWVALVSSKKKGTTWFRHAYKCHTHPKVKDAPKRRRESSHTRALAAAKMRGDPSTRDHTPQMTMGVSPLETLSMII